MTYEDLLAQVPDSLKPWAVQYGPALVTLTADELKNWIELALSGDVYATTNAIMAKLGSDAQLAAGHELVSGWKALNKKNADSMDLQKTAATAFVKVILALALAAVGL